MTEYQEVNSRTIDQWCRECFRVLRPGGVLLCGLDIGLNYAFDDGEDAVRYKLSFNPLKDPRIYEDSIRNGWGIQFSHTLGEQIGGQLEAAFQLTALYDDTNSSGNLRDHNIPTFVATRAVKR